MLRGKVYECTVPKMKVTYVVEKPATNHTGKVRLCANKEFRGNESGARMDGRREPIGGRMTEGIKRAGA